MDIELKEVIQHGEDKKRRVLRFLAANSGWEIQDIMEKFNLECDVKKDYGRLVKMAFYADESMRVECFSLTMPYSEVMAFNGLR